MITLTNNEYVIGLTIIAIAILVIVTVTLRAIARYFGVEDEAAARDSTEPWGKWAQVICPRCNKLIEGPENKKGQPQPVRIFELCHNCELILKTKPLENQIFGPSGRPVHNN